MPHTREAPELERGLRTRRDLLEEGETERGIAAAVRTGALHRVRRGWYVDGDLWRDLWPEGHHLLEVLACTRDSRSDATVVSHISAAVAWGLPLYKLRPRTVHLTTAEGRISSCPDARRHRAQLPDTDVTERHGFRCTTLERTVFDVMRCESAEAAIACGDAGMRLRTVDGRKVDEDAVDRWRAGLRARADAATGARGIRQARALIDEVDGRAERPGESVSRLQLRRLGFARINLQVPVPAPDGGKYHLDFDLEDVGTLAEFDGEVKYLDEKMRAGRTVERVVLDEKSREDWIRGVTGRRMIRWGSSDIGTPAALAARLRAFRITAPRDR